MSMLRKLLQLSPVDLIRLGQISGLLLVAEASLRWVPFQVILQALEQRRIRAQATPRHAPDPAKLARLAWLVETADYHGPFRPSCLRRSLALRWLLSEHGVSSMLKIGVAKHRKRLLAHAWVEVIHPQPLPFFKDSTFVDLTAPPAIVNLR